MKDRSFWDDPFVNRVNLMLQHNDAATASCAARFLSLLWDWGQKRKGADNLQNFLCNETGKVMMLWYIGELTKVEFNEEALVNGNPVVKDKAFLSLFPLIDVFHHGVRRRLM